MEKLEMFYEGKAKKLYRTSSPDFYIQEFKDSLTAFNAQKKGSFPGKGIVNRKITTLIFKFLEKRGVSTHFVDLIGEREMVIKSLKIFPLEIVVRNRATGSLAKRLGLQEGLVLKKPLIEFYYKKDELADPLVTEDHIELLDLAKKEQIPLLKELAVKVNQELIEFFDVLGIVLVDFKIEAGRDAGGKILLADEITPDSCRLWDKATGEKLDKDRFRQDLGKVEESYRLVCKKIIQKWGEAL